MAAGNPGSKMREVWALPGVALLAVTTVGKLTAESGGAIRAVHQVDGVGCQELTLPSVPQTDSGGLALGWVIAKLDEASDRRSHAHCD